MCNKTPIILLHHECWGTPMRSLLSSLFTKYTHPDDLTVDLALYGELLSNKRESYQIEKRYVRKDEKVVWARLTASKIRETQGEILFTFAIS